MARPLRLEFPGALYHVMARGNAREPIVRDDYDREQIISGLGRVCARLGWCVWAYCVMDNHYHIVVETSAGNLSRGMRDLNGVYSQAFNRRHERVGHVFQGRYKAVLVDRDAYILELSRYVVLNPVRAGLCRTAGDWQWSSYGVAMGSRPTAAWLASESMLGYFGATRDDARRAYAAFVAEGISAPAPLAANPGSPFLGDERFVTHATAMAKGASPEIPKPQRAWLSLAQYHRLECSRNAAIRAAYASGAHTLRSIGDYFGLHYATVSRIARYKDVSKQDLTPTQG
ncbi:MAG: transposase [Gemmatimonadaceae bacterium]